MDALKESWWILPLFILLARTADVSLGTLRVIFVARGHRLWAPLTGFFEVLIWLLAVSQIMSNLDNWICFLAYPTGYALGAYLGICIERWLAMGFVLLRIIPNGNSVELATILREQGLGVTQVNGEGAKGRISILFTVVRRRKLMQVLKTVRDFHHKVFYTVEDVRLTQDGIHTSFPERGLFALGIKK
jgi:uncharacterized protein YebE (UPF0316 family)